MRQLFEADLTSEVSGRIFETLTVITLFTSLDPVHHDTIQIFTLHILKIHFNTILVHKGHFSTALNRVRCGNLVIKLQEIICIPFVFCYSVLIYT